MTINSLAFNRTFDTSIGGQLLNVFRPAVESKPRVRASNGEAQDRFERTATVTNEDVLEIEHLIEGVLQEMEMRARDEFTLTHKVFDLRPLSSKRVAVRIRKVEPAQFYFVADDVPVANSSD